MWIDDENRFRKYEEYVLRDGQWQLVERQEIQYDQPIDPTLMSPDFGPSVRVIGPEDAATGLFSLENAVETRELMGLTFAVHEVHRSGPYILVATSLRPTAETRELVTTDPNEGAGLDLLRYGHYNLVSWWNRLEDGSLEQHPYAITELASFQCGDVLIHWHGLLAKEQWEGSDEQLELSLYLGTGGKYRRIRDAHGQPLNQRFMPLMNVPLPESESSMDSLAAEVYNTATTLMPIASFAFEFKPNPQIVKADQWQATLAEKLTALQPIGTLWEQVGSQVTVRLVGPDNRPVANALVGTDVRMDDNDIYWWTEQGRKPCETSDQNGTVTLEGTLIKDPGTSRQFSTLVFAIDKERKLAGVATLTYKDFGGTLTIEMAPACHVKAELVCPQFEDLKFVQTYLSRLDDRLLSGILIHTTKTMQLDILLPPGEYEVSYHGRTAEGKSVQFKGRLLQIPEDKRVVDFGRFELAPQDL